MMATQRRTGPFDRRPIGYRRLVKQTDALGTPPKLYQDLQLKVFKNQKPNLLYTAEDSSAIPFLVHPTSICSIFKAFS